MSAHQSLVDQIVARVMARLGSNEAACFAADEPASHDAGMFFNERVLTEQTLTERINGSTQIRVAPQTILTPSAKDYLRRLGVTWTRSSETTTGGTPAAQHQLIVLDEPTSLEAMQAGAWKITRVTSVNEAVQAAIDSVHTIGSVVLAGPAEAVACEANRDARVCAVAVCSLDRLQKIKADLQPNVVCVDPAGLGLYELRNILKQVKE